MYCELEERLYRSRNAFSLLAKFGKIPLLDTYRQMAIRQQKAKNWPAAIWWAERGLSLYAEDVARPEAVDVLEKRILAYRSNCPRRESPSGSLRPPR